MKPPWQELDLWAWEIETGRYTTGNRVKDSKKHQAIIRVRDKLWQQHLKENKRRYFPHGKEFPPSLYCTERFWDRAKMAIPHFK